MAQHHYGSNIRIWLDELPSWAEVPIEPPLETRLRTGAVGVAVRNSAAIEIFRPVGATFQYGLLGATFAAAKQSQFELRARLHDSSKPLSASKVLVGSALERVSAGFPEEYLGGVVAGVEALQEGLRPMGVWDFSHMVHGEIGSSPYVFQRLTSAVLRLLTQERALQSLDEARALLEPTP